MDVRCTDCNQNVEGRAIYAGSKVYHRGHFRCSTCQLAIRNFYYTCSEDGKPICYACKSVQHPVCKKCEKFVGETFIRAEGDPYHLDCFVCHGCAKPFPGGEYYRHNGAVFDIDCYWAQVAVEHCK
uniref:LIM zinc-binding domain-containing protein n=1 Tax=Panagrellus redivivus TaxID=6233 RepID=A0A7E4UXW2_PANRE